MFDALTRAESKLHQLLHKQFFHESWTSICIDHEAPIVHRLMTPFEGGFIHLHKLFPCEKPYYHPHPWPCAVKVFGEGYTMGIGGFALDLKSGRPPVFATLQVSGRFSYEMTHPGAWHYVCPTIRPVFSLMVVGARYPEAKVQSRAFHQLKREEELEILQFFDNVYGDGKSYLED